MQEAERRGKRTHHRLKAWREAIELVKETYRVTGDFPDSERYGLVSQMRRAAISVPSNIAEGAARGTKKEFAHFLSIARGSLSELETHVIISSELGFLEDEGRLRTNMDRVFRLIAGFATSLDGAMKK